MWHDGLLFKLKCYPADRSFFIRQGEQLTTLYSIYVGVSQGSVLGPILYLLFTMDLPFPQFQNVTLGTFADDTVALSVDKYPVVATLKLQTCLNSISEWLLNWLIKANEARSVQVTFTTKYSSWSGQKLNDVSITQAEHAKFI